MAPVLPGPLINIENSRFNDSAVEVQVSRSSSERRVAPTFVSREWGNEAVMSKASLVTHAEAQKQLSQFVL